MTTAPAAHTWIDKVSEVFAISDRRLSQLRSFKMGMLKDLPPAITGNQTPCAVHYITSLQPDYSRGGPTILWWEGRSDFHLFADVKPANFSEALPFFPLILAAAMGNLKLGGLVQGFIIPNRPNALRFVTYKNPDGSDSHQGIEVNWVVEQHVSGEYTISA